MLNSDASYYWNSNWSPMAGGGNYAITYNDNFSTKELRIFKRNETGFYPRIATKTLTSEAKDVSTDGRFFTYEDKAAKSVEIFEVDDEGNIFNSQNVSSPTMLKVGSKKTNLLTAMEDLSSTTDNSGRII
jgi:hypothetical protein